MAGGQDCKFVWRNDSYKVMVASSNHGRVVLKAVRKEERQRFDKEIDEASDVPIAACEIAVLRIRTFTGVLQPNGHALKDAHNAHITKLIFETPCHSKLIVAYKAELVEDEISRYLRCVEFDGLRAWCWRIIRSAAGSSSMRSTGHRTWTRS